MKTAIVLLIVIFLAACAAPQQETVQENIAPLPPPQSPTEQVPLQEPVAADTSGGMEEVKQLLEDDLDKAVSDLEALQ